MSGHQEGGQFKFISVFYNLSILSWTSVIIRIRTGSRSWVVKKITHKIFPWWLRSHLPPYSTSRNRTPSAPPSSLMAISSSTTAASPSCVSTGPTPRRQLCGSLIQVGMISPLCTGGLSQSFILFPGKQWSWFPSVLSPPWEQNQVFLFHLPLSSIFLPGKQWSWFLSLFLPLENKIRCFFFTCLRHSSFSLVNDGAGFLLNKSDASF